MQCAEPASKETKAPKLAERAGMPGIREWLSSHGLSEYADRFAANRIDLSILPDLSDEDLGSLASFWGIAGDSCG